MGRVSTAPASPTSARHGSGPGTAPTATATTHPAVAPDPGTAPALEVTPSTAPDAAPAGVVVPTVLRWSDMDAYGHVNNVQFLRLMEEARIHVLRGGPEGAPSMLDSGVVVARAEVEYLVPLVYRAAPVDVRVWLTDLAAASFDLAYEFTSGPGGPVHARGETTLVPYDLQRDRPRRLTADERERLARLAGPAQTWRRRSSARAAAPAGGVR